MPADPDEIGPRGYKFRIICDDETGAWMVPRSRAREFDRVPMTGLCGHVGVWRFEHLLQWYLHQQKCHQLRSVTGYGMIASEIVWTMFCVQWTMLFSAVLYGRE